VNRNAGKSGRTGIFKDPASGPVAVRASGLRSDVVVDKKNHGGPDQAVYVFGTPDYEWWADELGRELPPGTLGENFTVSSLESASLDVGDRLYAGTTVLEVTAPRIPCATLAARMGDPAFLRRFRSAERPGVYCRVVREGYVEAGDAVNIEPYAGETVLVVEMFRDFFDPRPSEETILRQLAAPIAVRARAHKERQLEALTERGRL
jgi:MOSC domain-containing protein YiiM